MKTRTIKFLFIFFLFPYIYIFPVFAFEGNEILQTNSTMSLKILDQSTSCSEARDGMSIQVGYLIQSETDQSVILDFSLHSQDNQIIQNQNAVWNDQSTLISKGNHWYYKSFLINMPPGAPIGFYDATWRVKSSGEEFIRNKENYFTIISPIPISLPILLYHDISLEKDNYAIEPQLLKDHFSALKSYGYETITIQDLMEFRAGLKKPILITFVNGWRSMYNTVLSLLQQYDYVAECFVIPNNACGKSHLFCRSYLTWNQMREMEETGLVDIQSNSFSFKNFLDLNDENLFFELSNSKSQLEANLQKQVLYISWPYGKSDYRIQKMAHQCGYFAAFSDFDEIETNCYDKWQLKRLVMNSSITCDYNPQKPKNCFLVKLEDENCSFPFIQIHSVDYFDPETNEKIQTIAPGKRVAVRVTASNQGESAYVNVNYKLQDTFKDHPKTYFNSEDADFSQDSLFMFNAGGEHKVFSWTFDIPPDTPSGFLTHLIKFCDSQNVITYAELEDYQLFVNATSLKYIDTSLSQTEARDGMTLEIGSYMKSDYNGIGEFSFSLAGPNGELIDCPLAKNTDNLFGEKWHYQSFLLNMPPFASPGVYDAIWRVKWGEQERFYIKEDYLNILPTIPLSIPILLYHAVDTYNDESYTIHKDLFEKHLYALKSYGYESITIQDLMDFRAGLKTPPLKPILITFDDGRDNVYTSAIPLLRQFNFKAAFFVLPSKSESITYLSWDQIEDMQESGLFDIQSHTYTHAYLPEIIEEQLFIELQASKYILELKIQNPIKYIAWPYGFNGFREHQMAYQCGYFAALAVQDKYETDCYNKWQLRRLVMNSSITCDYDPENPKNCFLIKLQDPDFVYPLIQIHSVDYFNPQTGDILEIAKPGETIAVRALYSNKGEAAAITIRLILSQENDNVNSILFDSNNIISSGKDIL
ncbi:MAG: polysaccharide deacetylase family protein, partial [Candidatus Hinthialibacter sp.]